MFHQGYALKVFLKESKTTSVQDVATALDISRQGVNALYGQEILEPKYVNLLRKAKFDIPGVTSAAMGGNIENVLAEPVVLYAPPTHEVEKLQMQLKHSEEKIKLLEDRNSLLREMIDEIKKKG